MNKICTFIILIFCGGIISAQDLRFSYQVINPVGSQSKLVVYVQKNSPGTEIIQSFNFGFFYKSTEATVQGYPPEALDGNITVGETGTFLDMSYAEDLGWLAAWNSGSIVEVTDPPVGLSSEYDRRLNCAINDDNFEGAAIGTTPVPIVAITLDNSVGGGPNDMDSTYQLGWDNDGAITYLNDVDEFPVIITGNRLQPLPIELISFNAEKSGYRDALLTWSTASEINSSHFMVQRSYDKKIWKNVGQVVAAGNSQIIENYEFLDLNAYNGIDSRVNVYYRLQMFDIDGRSKFSPIDKVIFGRDAGREAIVDVSVYPNPATDGVYIGWEIEDNVQPTSIEMYDVSGKLILTHTVPALSIKEYVDFGNSGIQPGVYQLRLMSGDESIDYQQIVVGQNR